MPEYVSYNLLNGRIIDRFFSVDQSVVQGRDNIIQISRDEYNSLTKFHKVDSGTVRPMTQAEKDTFLAEEAQALIDAENVRIADIDDKVSKAQVTNFPMVKVDQVIDAISNLAEAKLFLKRLCRYLAKYAKNI